MFLVAQLGARMHYAVPQILEKASVLEAFHTDISANDFASMFQGVLPDQLLRGSLRRWAARVPHGVPIDRVKSFPGFGLRYAARRRFARGSAALTATHLWAGREFCRRVIQSGFGEATAVYTFNSAGLEILQQARSRGLLAVMEQTIAPVGVEDQLLGAEESDFPGWEESRRMNPYRREFQDRERAEWTAADVIVCGSEFVRDGNAIHDRLVQSTDANRCQQFRPKQDRS